MSCKNPNFSNISIQISFIFLHNMLDNVGRQYKEDCQKKNPNHSQGHAPGWRHRTEGTNILYIVSAKYITERLRVSRIWASEIRLQWFYFRLKPVYTTAHYLKMVKIDLIIIILLHQSKSVTHYVVLIKCKQTCSMNIFLLFSCFSSSRREWFTVLHCSTWYFLVNENLIL